jgi:hypothetical protein
MQAVYLIIFLIVCAFLMGLGGFFGFLWALLCIVTTHKIDRKLTSKNQESYRGVPRKIWWIVFTIFGLLNLFFDEDFFPNLNFFFIVPAGGWLYLGIKSWLTTQWSPLD